MSDYIISRTVHVVCDNSCMAQTVMIDSFCTEYGLHAIFVGKDSVKGQELMSNVTAKKLPLVFDDEGWLVADYNTYEKALLRKKEESCYV